LPWFHRAVPSATLDKDIYLRFIVPAFSGLSRVFRIFQPDFFARAGNIQKMLVTFSGEEGIMLFNPKT
jgi:hypothetical protein